MAAAAATAATAQQQSGKLLNEKTHFIFNIRRQPGRREEVTRVAAPKSAADVSRVRMQQQQQQQQQQQREWQQQQRRHERPSLRFLFFCSNKRAEDKTRAAISVVRTPRSLLQNALSAANCCSVLAAPLRHLNFSAAYSLSRARAPRHFLCCCCTLSTCLCLLVAKGRQLVTGTAGEQLPQTLNPKPSALTTLRTRTPDP